MKKLIFLIPFLFTFCDSNQAALKKFEANSKTVSMFFEAFSNNDIDKMKSYVVDDFLWTPPMSNLDSLSVEDWESQMRLFNDLYDNIQFTNAQYFAGLDDNMKPNGDVRVYGTWKSNYALTGEATELDYYSVLFFNEETTKFIDQDVIKNSFGGNIYYPKGKASITNAIVVLEPGQSFPTHMHTGFNIGTILQGEFTVEDEMGNKVVKKAGETYIGTPNVWHTAKNESKEKTILVGSVLGVVGMPATINKE
jgi:quercetin dioxygenase-like cupin family protein